MPKISILTPVFNAEGYIGEAIKSVAKSTFQDYEHIIVDDGSTDSSRKAIYKALSSLSDSASSKVKVYTKENSGEAATDNFAFSMSTGQLVLVLNADDIVSPNLLGRSVEEMEKHPHIVVTYPDWTMIDQNGNQISQTRTKEYGIETLIGKFECLPGPGACIRRSAISEDFLRDPKFPLVSDYECWQRLSLKGPFLRIPEFLAYWRLHGENLSITRRGSEWANQAILVATEFASKDFVKSNQRMKRLASLGLSRAYLLAASQAVWDPKVPYWKYLKKYAMFGFRNGRVFHPMDLPVLAQIVYSKLIGRFRLGEKNYT